MPKVDRAKLLQTMKAIEKQYGVGSVYTVGSDKAIMDIQRWSTGIEELDAILGGGMPEGRVIEIFGCESAGKTSLTYHLMAQCEIALDIPIEGTFDAKRAMSFGNRKGQLIVRRANTGEQTLEMTREFARASCPCIVIDSVPSMITDKEFEEEDMEKATQPGRIAALLSTKLPKIVNICERSGTTLIFINQLRDQMQAMLFGPTTHTPGGRALRHYCSLRIQVARKAWIKIPNKDPKNSSKDRPIGLIMKIKVVKSKVCEPLGECEVPMFFNKGFVSMEEYKEIRKELMREQNAKFKTSKKDIDTDDEDDDDE
jgi:recombination protein RecA